MNYVYDPKVQADIAEYVNYVTPVDGRQGRSSRKRDPALAENQLIFPSPDYTKNCTFEPVLGGELGRKVTKAFNEVLDGLRAGADALDRGAADGAGRPRPGGHARAASPSALAGVRAAVPGRAALVLAPELHLSGQPGLLEEQSGYPDEVAVADPRPAHRARSPTLAREHRRLARPRLGLRAGRRRAHPQHRAGLLARRASWSPATARSSPGSRTRTAPRAIASSPSTSPTSAGSGWPSVTTATSRRRSASSPGWAPRSSCSRR